MVAKSPADINVRRLVIIYQMCWLGSHPCMRAYKLLKIIHLVGKGRVKGIVVQCSYFVAPRHIAATTPQRQMHPLPLQ